MRAPRSILCTALASLLLASSAAGQRVIPEPEVERRLAFLTERLDSHRTHAQAWHWSWTIANAGAAVGLGVLGGLADDRSDKASYWSQSALATMGLADLYFIRPLPARTGADEARALLDGSDAGRRAALSRAEELLARSALRERERTRWPIHVANFAVNTTAGLVVWAAGSGTDGLINALAGIAGGELYLWSEPWGRRDDLRDYARFREGLPQAPAARWSVSPAPGGLALRLEF